MYYSPNVPDSPKWLILNTGGFSEHVTVPRSGPERVAGVQLLHGGGCVGREVPDVTLAVTETGKRMKQGPAGWAGGRFGRQIYLFLRRACFR